MKALRIKGVAAASALLCAISAGGASFEKGPIELPAALPIQLSMPFGAVPADALNALDPLSKAIPAVPPAAAVAAARPPALPAAAARMSASVSPRAASSSGESAQSQRQRLDGQFDGAAELSREPDFQIPAGIGASLVKAPLPNPERFYERAFSEAAYYASRKGVSREGLSLEKITGNVPASEAAPHLMYGFDAQAQGRAYKIYVDFSPRWAAPGQDYGSRVSLHDMSGAAPERVALPEQSAPSALRARLRASPQRALDLARRKLPELSPSVSFKLGLVRGEPVYVFYDRRGGRVAVSARTGAVSILERPSAAPGAGEHYRRLKDSFGKLVRRAALARPKVRRAQIEAAAASAAAHKGRPWSQTEYDANRASVAYHLKTHGATEAQLKLFYELTDKAPILNGGFNPWSGD